MLLQYIHIKHTCTSNRERSSTQVGDWVAATRKGSKSGQQVAFTGREGLGQSPTTTSASVESVLCQCMLCPVLGVIACSVTFCCASSGATAAAGHKRRASAQPKEETFVLNSVQRSSLQFADRHIQLVTATAADQHCTCTTAAAVSTAAAAAAATAVIRCRLLLRGALLARSTRHATGLLLVLSFIRVTVKDGSLLLITGRCGNAHVAMLIGAMRLTQTFVTCMYVCCVVVATDATLQAPGVPKYMFSAAQEEKGQVRARAVMPHELEAIDAMWGNLADSATGAAYDYGSDNDEVLQNILEISKAESLAKYQAQQAAYKEATAATAAAARKTAEEVAQREAAELKAVLEQSVLEDTGYQLHGTPWVFFAGTLSCSQARFISCSSEAQLSNALEHANACQLLQDEAERLQLEAALAESKRAEQAQRELQQQYMQQFAAVGSSSDSSSGNSSRANSDAAAAATAAGAGTTGAGADAANGSSEADDEAQLMAALAASVEEEKRRAAYAAKKEAAQLEAALAASKAADSSSSVHGTAGAGAAADMSEEEMLAQAMQASLAISQTTQQWQLGAGTAATTTAAAASDSDASPVETCRKWYATEASIILSTTRHGSPCLASGHGSSLIGLVISASTYLQYGMYVHYQLTPLPMIWLCSLIAYCYYATHNLACTHCSQLEPLQSMGFSEAASAKALIDKGGNVDRALSHLFDTAASGNSSDSGSDDSAAAAASSDSLLTKKLAASGTGAGSDSWGAVPHSAAPSNFDAYGYPVVYNNHAPVMDSWGAAAAAGVSTVAPRAVAPVMGAYGSAATVATDLGESSDYDSSDDSEADYDNYGTTATAAAATTTAATAAVNANNQQHNASSSGASSATDQWAASKW
eukprot:1781-Heterococcus_DN1.PRE.3